MTAGTSQQVRKKMLVGLGEVLWDLLPAGKQLGGAPANFAYHAQALGAEAHVITRVGNDPLGQEILHRLQASGLATNLVSIDPNLPTGSVSVDLAADGQPHFTIHENVAWDNLEATEGARALMSRCDAVCFGSLCQRGGVAARAIRSLVSVASPQALRIFDINLRQQYFSREVIEASLEIANALKINEQELPVLANMLRLNGDPSAQIVQLAEKFGLALVALTRGAKGSLLYAYGTFSDHPGSAVQVVDSVGAGDSFTAAMALGFLTGVELGEINRRANALASYVCTQSGATPPIPKELRSFFSRL